MYNLYSKKLKKYSKDTHSFSKNYDFWSRYLMERVARLFEWEGLPFPQKELEFRLLTNGYCAIVPKDKSYMVANCSLSGVTEYYDEFTTMTWATPKGSGTHLIDTRHILCNNDSLRTSIIPIVHHYAVELAHCSVTLVDSLVNKRAENVITAPTGNASESAMSFINDLFEGNIKPINDDLFGAIKFNNFNNSTNSTFNDCYELQHNILASFFECFGIASAYRKKGNMTDDEVNREDNLLLVNINDMIKAREEIADKLSKAMNTTITVKSLVKYENVSRETNEEGGADNDN